MLVVEKRTIADKFFNLAPERLPDQRYGNSFSRSLEEK